MFEFSYKNIRVFFITIALGLAFCFPQYAAVAPNGRLGACGPYYIWYQMSPDAYPSLIDYVDLCSITFDISDVIKDFDFVWFTDTDIRQRAALDQDQDGVSDRYFVGRTQNFLEWKPPNGCVRIPLQECQGGTRLKEHCGYAMISIQPKPGFQQGSARIKIGVHAKCPPNGVDCSRTYETVHRYANCVFQPDVPTLIVQKKANKLLANSYSPETIEYTVTVQNTGSEKENSVILTDTMSTGTVGGTLKFKSLNTICGNAVCSVLSVTSQQIRVSFGNIPPNGQVELFYVMTTPKDEIPYDKFSYFTNTVTLSTGGSSRVTVGVRGLNHDLTSEPPKRREERPIGSSSK